MRECYDVAVIGGGPAGTVAAMVTAEAGRSVCLLEKQAFPREVLCGEFLSHEVVTTLGRLGLSERLLALRPNTVERFTFTPSSGVKVTVPLGFRGHAVRRSLFDAMLLDAARERGVEVHTEADVVRIERGDGKDEIAWQEGTERRTLHARRIIGAWGRRSPLDRSLGRGFAHLRTGYTGVKVHIPASAVSGLAEEEILIAVGNGMYCGMNHVGGGTVTICYLDRRKPGSSPSRMRMEELVRENGSVGEILGTQGLAAIRTAHIYGCGDIFFGTRSVVERGVLLVGDAAGVIAPVAGDGIGMAIEGGAMLGGMLAAGSSDRLRAGTFDEEYTRRWHSLFRARIRMSMIAQGSILATSRFPSVGGVLSSFPSVLRFAISATRARP